MIKICKALNIILNFSAVMGVGTQADKHSGYVPSRRHYAILKATKPDFIIDLGDKVGGHVGRDMWDYQDPHDWVKCVNFARVREPRRVPKISGPTQESIDALLAKHPIDNPHPEDIARLLDEWFVPMQAELSQPIIDIARDAPIDFGHMAAEDDYVPIVSILGNQDIIFMVYVETGNPPEDSIKINKKTLALIKAQVDYAFQGYDHNIFFELMDEIGRMGKAVPQSRIKDEIKKILISAKRNPAEIEQRADYNILVETIPAVAFLRKLYQQQKEPEKQHIVVEGSRIKALVTHSFPPGSDVYVTSRQNPYNPGTSEHGSFERHHMTPAQTAKMIPEVEAKLGIQGINAIFYAHTHEYDESIETFFDPKSKTVRRVLIAGSGNSGHSIEAKGVYKAATGFMFYDVSPDNCTMLVEGPI